MDDSQGPRVLVWQDFIRVCRFALRCSVGIPQPILTSSARSPRRSNANNTGYAAHARGSNRSTHLVGRTPMGGPPGPRGSPPGPAARPWNQNPTRCQRADGGVGRGLGGPPHAWPLSPPVFHTNEAHSDQPFSPPQAVAFELLGDGQRLRIGYVSRSGARSFSGGLPVTVHGADAARNRSLDTHQGNPDTEGTDIVHCGVAAGTRCRGR
jgi:hypothetical protein